MYSIHNLNGTCVENEWLKRRNHYINLRRGLMWTSLAFALCSLNRLEHKLLIFYTKIGINNQFKDGPHHDQLYVFFAVLHVFNIKVMLLMKTELDLLLCSRYPRSIAAFKASSNPGMLNFSTASGKIVWGYSTWVQKIEIVLLHIKSAHDVSPLHAGLSHCLYTVARTLQWNFSIVDSLGPQNLSLLWRFLYYSKVISTGPEWVSLIERFPFIEVLIREVPLQLSDIGYIMS